MIEKVNQTIKKGQLNDQKSRLTSKKLIYIEKDDKFDLF